MRLHTWLVALGLSLLLASTAASKPPPTVSERLYAIACSQLRVNCRGLPAPKVVHTDNPFILLDDRNLGVYLHGGDTIYVNKKRHMVEWDQIILHETVHYIHDQLRMGLTRCQSEEQARVITARVFNKEVDPEWRVRYECPAPV